MRFAGLGMLIFFREPRVEAAGRIASCQHLRVVLALALVGAEIGGVDLAKPLKDHLLGEIRHGFGEYGVVLFRDRLPALRRGQQVVPAMKAGEVARTVLTFE